MQLVLFLSLLIVLAVFTWIVIRRNPDAGSAPAVTSTFKAESVDSFHLEQLKALRAEADKLVEETRLTERYVLLAAGAIYTFLFVQFKPETNGQNILLPSAWMGWLIPPALAVLGFLRCLALYARISQLSAYIRQAEKVFNVTGVHGWETWLWKHERERTVAAIAAVIWVLIISGSFWLSVAGIRNGFFSGP